MADLHAVVQKMIDAGESEENIATVIKASAPSPVSAGDMMSGRVGRETNLSDSSEPQPPDWKTKLGAALEPLAHPQSTSDFLSLLIPSGIGGAISAAKGYGRVAKDAIAESPRLRQIPGQMLKRLTQSAHVSPTGPEGMASVQARHAIDFPTEGSGGWHPETANPEGWRTQLKPRPPEPELDWHPETANPEGWRKTAAAEPYPAGHVGDWSPETANPEGWRAQAKLSGPMKVETGTASAPPAGTGALSSTDRAGLTKAGYSPELIAKIEQRAAQQQPVSFKPIQPAASSGQPAMAVDLKSVPDSWKPFAQPNTADVPFSQPHPLDPSRVDVGAERTGRTVGMTKQEVRDVATPILGGQYGDASAVLPDAAFTRIVQTMKQLAPGAEREAYVAKATSGKTQWQVHNIMRTLRDLGLIGVAATGGEGTRRALLSQMAGGQESQ